MKMHINYCYALVVSVVYYCLNCAIKSIFIHNVNKSELEIISINYKTYHKSQQLISKARG